MKKREPRPGLPLRLALWARRLESRIAASELRRARMALSFYRLFKQLVYRWIRDRCPQQASSLAFQTVLSLVPLMALALVAFRATGSAGAELRLVEFVGDRLATGLHQDSMDRIYQWSENVSLQSLGVAGIIAFLAIAFVMFNSIEKSINQIWRVERRRSLAQRFVVFYASATIGPLLFGTSLYHAAKYGLTDGVSGVAMSVGVSFSALFLLNFFLPATPVHWRAALIGAAFTTIATEVAKLAFANYVGNVAFDRYSGVYGAFAAFPLFLIWIYWSWLMVLLGVEIAHTVQNLRLLRGFERRDPLSLENELLSRVTGPMAARIMVVITNAYRGGQERVTRGSLADRFDLSLDAVDRLVHRLKDHKLLLEANTPEIGLLPARPPNSIMLSEVLALFRSDDARAPVGTPTAKLDTLLDTIEAQTVLATEGVSLADLS